MLVAGLGNLKFMEEQKTGRLEAIWIKRAHKGPMDSVSEAELVEGQGLKNNADQGGRRQVAILSKERWEEATSISTGPPATRTAAILSKERWEEATAGLVETAAELEAGLAGAEEQSGQPISSGGNQSDNHIHPKDRRANLFVSGLDLEATRGWTLAVGGHRLVIAGETKPCAFMDDICDGLQDALRPHWGGGAYAQVLDSGTISIGDRVTLTPPSEGD